MGHARAFALVSATLSTLASTARAQQTAAPSPVLTAMREELTRSLEQLKTQTDPPYFLSYEITETATVTVSASYGAVTASRESRRRVLDIDLRVGDYAFDNTRQMLGFGSGGFGGIGFPAEVPLDDDPAAIRAMLWYQTDRKYRTAVEQLTRLRTNAQVKVGPEDSSADLSRESAARFLEPILKLAVDRKVWETKLKRYTAPFARLGDVYQGGSSFTATVETRWYVNSEGAEVQVSEPQYRLYLSGVTKADDGMELPRFESWFAFAPDGLPADAQVLKAADRIIVDLRALKKAPVVDPYTGPAILSGRASAVFFHEVFGHRIEGHRQKLENEGQTFKKKIDQPVLPETFSVYFDPTARRRGATDLMGYYPVDNEGVTARRVTVVERGILKEFLMSRSPIQGFPVSNGHGRAQAGLKPVARQSNLIVDAKEPKTRAELKAMLIDQMKRDGKAFGLYFDDIQGGFTITQRTIPNAFNVLPVMVYRVTPDGKEELVRGVDLIGTPLTAFSKIAAADNQIEVFNGICGAESGAVPVSAISPGLLISQVEVQKKAKSSDRPPILPPPFDTVPAKRVSLNRSAR